MISLSKKEELLHLPGVAEPIRLGREHLGLRLCQAIRDEAHRFAQHYHHLLREKSLMGETARQVRKKRAIKALQDEKDRNTAGSGGAADDAGTQPGASAPDGGAAT